MVVNITMENTTSELEIFLMCTVVCMSIHLFYILLLIKVIMVNKGEAWRNPINAMILFNEGTKFVSSVFLSMGGVTALTWVEVANQPGISYLGNGSMCQIVYSFGLVGGSWIFLDGAGM